MSKLLEVKRRHFEKQYRDWTPEQLQVLLKEKTKDLKDFQERVDNGESLTRLDGAQINEAMDLVNWILDQPTESPVTHNEPIHTESSDTRVFEPGEKVDYRSLFGEFPLQSKKVVGKGGFDSFNQFVSIILRNQFDPKLEARFDGQETVGFEGGFLIPEFWSEQILNPALEKSIVIPRCRKYPMKSNSQKIPAWEIGSHASHVMGGIIAYWLEEEGSYTRTFPKVREINLILHKLGVLARASDELLEDMPNVQNLINLLSDAVSWYSDAAFLNGTGVGQPAGLVGSSACIQVAKETGQTADTILYANLRKMYARMHPGCLPNAIWIANNDTIPELLNLSIPMGTAGAFYPVMRERGGSFEIFGKQVLFTEKLPTLGDAGDILFVDLSQYAVGMRKEIQMARTNAVSFTTGQQDIRLTWRIDGQCLWDEALTPKESSDTLSCIVKLADRA